MARGRKPATYGRDQGTADRSAVPALRELFPKVSLLRLAFTFQDREKPSPSGQVHALHPPARAYFRFPCPAAGCNGEYELGSVIDAAVRRSATEARESRDCAGVRAEHRATGQACGLHLDCRIEITY